MSTHQMLALADNLVQMRLLTQTQIDQILASLSGAEESVDGMLKLLESRSLLTSYQISRIRKNELNDLVLGEFKLMYQNASGSFARVFRGASLSNGEMVGIKVLRSRWAQEAKHIEDFHREAQLGMTLQHKNIVPIYTHGTEGNSHYLVMEFVEGGNLRDFIQIRKKIAPVEALQYTLDMAEGLDYALSMGFTHRDLKLTNVLMSSRGVAKLVDFGLARTDDEAHHQRAVEYATLEKATGAKRNDPRSDLFFLGVILYELLSGTPPYPRTSDFEERKLVSRYSQIRPIEQIEPNLTAEVREVVSRLISFQPENRYQSAGELVRELAPIVDRLHEQRPDDSNSAKSSFSEPEINAVPDSPSSTSGKELPTVLCVEERAKQQNLLREYLSKRGFRPLVMSDVDRALRRCQNNPPDCVVFFGESNEDDLFRGFQVAKATSKRVPFGIVAVLSKEQKGDAQRLVKTSSHRVLTAPITLRDLRKEIHLALQAVNQDSSELDAVVS